MHGNVRDWCQDSFRALQHESLVWLQALGLPAYLPDALLDEDKSMLPEFTPEELAKLEDAEPLLDPVFLVEEAGGRTRRSGDFRDTAAAARSSARAHLTRDDTYQGLGLRPARGIVE